MTKTDAVDSSEVEVGNGPPPPPPPPETTSDMPLSRGGNKVYKSGPLFLSSKGIGWTSWKKRWFILTRTSLVFFRTDPNAVPPRGAEVNLTLGGIDLNSSGSVVVKEDKKLITMVFPDSRDGRSFTLKADTLEDLHEWKAALEEALANAPIAPPAMGQNGITKNDQTNEADASIDQAKDKQPEKSLVIGRPILLALEDIDGTPSFLEKALRFVEEHGVNAEGVLRQAADVEDVENRIREYEQGKTEFSSDEDAHVIADCVKYVLRELPSSPVPASCCNALLEASRTERGMRVSAMRHALNETFPEPNRRLLQRILMMMQTVAAHKAQNRMSTSAVAACMAPLLLRPLLAGDCELEHNFDVGGDGSLQLLQAAAAANHAQTIVIILLEEYDNLFGEGTMTSELYSEGEESGSEDELSEDYETSDDDCDYDVTEVSDADIDDNYEHTSSGASSEVGRTEYNDIGSGSSHSGPRSEQADDILEPDHKLASSSTQKSLPHHGIEERIESNKNQSKDNPIFPANNSGELVVTDPDETSTSQKSSNASNGTAHIVRSPTVWGRTSAKKNLSTESIDFPTDEESEIQKLEDAKYELQSRLAEEAKRNKKLQGSLERQKNALHERRLALEKDVARLQELIQKERELRAVLEAGLEVPQGPISASSSIDEKTKRQLEEIAQAESDVINLKQKTADLGVQLNQEREQNSRFGHNSTYQPQPSPSHHQKLNDKQKDVNSTAPTNMLEKSRSKLDTHLDSAESDKDKKQEFSSSTRKHSAQNLMQNPSSNPRTTGFLATTSSTDVGMDRSASSNRMKTGVRGEGANPNSSPVTKLTNRLNFLKEKRTQTANELENSDKGMNTNQPTQSLERGKGSESLSSSQSTDKSQGSEAQSSEKSRGADSNQAPNNVVDRSFASSYKGRRPEGLPNLDRGKSETFPMMNQNLSRMFSPRPHSR